jgi:parallel beta-helix repeat protein
LYNGGKSLIRKGLAVGLILLLIGTSVIPITAQDTERSLLASRGNWLYVGGSGPGNYTKIQDAINDSSNGDTVFVFHGTYNERIVVNKPIDLIGENKENTMITDDSSVYGSMVLISADHVCFTGFCVSKAGGNGMDVRVISDHNTLYDTHLIKSNFGIVVDDSCFNDIFNNSIETTNVGIIIAGRGNNCSYNTVHDNRITNYGASGYSFTGAIHIEEAANNTISGNYIYNSSAEGIGVTGYDFGLAQNNKIINNIIVSENGVTASGILLAYNPLNYPYPDNIHLRTTIIGNTISNCSYGILLNSNNNIISENTLSNNTLGIYLSGVGWNVMTNNTITQNQMGIVASGSMFCTISGNTITLNRKRGLSFDYFSNENIISKNNIKFNLNGIYLQTASKNTITLNNFILNGVSVKCSLCRNNWTGNYWNRPHVFPKPIFGFLPFVQFDWYPAQKPYDI